MKFGKSFFAEQLRRFLKATGKPPAQEPVDLPWEHKSIAVGVDGTDVPMQVIDSGTIQAGSITADSICASFASIKTLKVHHGVTPIQAAHAARIRGHEVTGIYIDEFGDPQDVAMTREEYRDMQRTYPHAMRDRLVIDNVWSISTYENDPDTQADDEAQDRALAEENQSLRQQLEAIEAESEVLRKSKQDKYIEESLF